APVRIVGVTGAEGLHVTTGAAIDQVHQVDVERLVLVPGPGRIAAPEVPRAGAAAETDLVWWQEIIGEPGHTTLERAGIPDHQVDFLDVPCPDSAVVRQAGIEVEVAE